MQVLTHATCFLFLFLTLSLSAQEGTSGFAVPTTNPGAVVEQRIAATTVEITYHRPSVRGRTIFGKLVPFGQVWRTGSDAATRIAFSTPVMLSGIAIEAGTYEIFTIPGKDQWTVILQESRSQWGSYAYDPSYDVARINVVPVQLHDAVESFTMSLDDIKPNAAVMNISWDKVRVPVKIEIDLEKTVLPELEAALQAEGRRPYFLAAMFYFENDLDINRAAELMTLAVDANPDHIGMLYRLALILEGKGDISGAKAAAERSLSGAASANAELREEYTRLNTLLLGRLNQD